MKKIYTLLIMCCLLLFGQQSFAQFTEIFESANTACSNCASFSFNQDGITYNVNVSGASSFMNDVGYDDVEARSNGGAFTVTISRDDGGYFMFTGISIGNSLGATDPVTVGGYDVNSLVDQQVVSTGSSYVLTFDMEAVTEVRIESSNFSGGGYYFDNFSGNNTVTPTCSLAAAITSQNNIACNGDSTGSLTVTATNGDANYNYEWTKNSSTIASSSGSSSNSNSISGLTAGSYTVTVTDANGCSDTASATITQPSSALSVTPSSQTNIACNGGTTGAASVNPATGGTAPYTYNWTPGNPTGDGTTSVSGLTVGTWTCTVTDNNGCNDTQSFTITQPASAVNLTPASQTNIACNGGATGAAAINAATGGTAPYTYNWTPGNPTGDGTTSVSGLTTGTWTVTATDANGCNSAQSFTITEPTSALSGTFTSVNDISCNEANDGSAILNVNGGTAPYNVTLSNGAYFNNNYATTYTFNNLIPGTFKAYITDANGCQIGYSQEIEFSISEPTPLMVSLTTTDVSATEVSDGTATVNPTGGTTPFAYQWDSAAGNQTTQTATGLTIGTYNVTITDANGCTTTAEAVIEETIAPDANNILYVNKTATGDNLGGSWANAIPELADALKYAKEQDDYTTETTLQIWVAGGTYKPLYSPADNNFGNPDGRNNSFLMVDNVELYGGFAGTETVLTQRDLSLTANETILSGDINSDDQPNYSEAGDITSYSNLTDNSIHILINVDNLNTTRLDGFTVTGGYYESNSISIEGNAILNPRGQGLYIKNASPQIVNSTFFRNVGAQIGGAIYVDGGNPTIMNSRFTYSKGPIGSAIGVINTSNITVENCKFDNSFVGGGGGSTIYLEANSVSSISNSDFIDNNDIAIRLQGAGITSINECNFINNTGNKGTAINIYNSTVLVNNSLFDNNSSSDYGGAIYSFGSSLAIDKCIFTNNSAGTGGAIYNEMSDGSNSIEVSNSLIANNVSDGAAIVGFFVLNQTFLNTTVVDNTSLNDSEAIYIAGNASVKNSIIFGGFNSSSSGIYQNSLVDSNTDFTNGNIDATGLTPEDIFKDPANNDYSLLTSSVTVDAGSNSLYEAADGDTDNNSLQNDTDLAGNSRLYEENIDMGAYEYQGEIGYVYENGTWTPQNPIGNSTAVDNITIVNGIVDFTEEVTCNNLTVEDGAVLNIFDVLNLNGDLTSPYGSNSGGAVLFKSLANKNGELAELSPDSEIFGPVITERYVSANRAYRMISSPTNSELAGQPIPMSALLQIESPLPLSPSGLGNDISYGTHITGSITGANGFDATVTGEPSMFTLDVANQAFTAIANTNATILEHAKAYLLFVRGDRSIDLTSNDATPTATRLLFAGEMPTGDQVQDFTTTNAGDYVMFGNPYQSAVDMSEVVANSTNVNTSQFYVYDPTLGDSGAYVTVPFSGTPTPAGSDADIYLQPGQGAQIASVSAGNVSLLFQENNKAPGNHASTFRNANNLEAAITASLYTTDNYIAGKKPHDGFALNFSNDYTNAITMGDAVKPFNFSENVGVVSNNDTFSIEQREMPFAGEEISLYSSGYKHTNYTFVLNLENLDGLTAIFKDAYTNTETVLESGENVLGFSVDEAIEASISENRFSLYFGEDNLSVNTSTTNFGIELYPNPSSAGNTFYITTGQFKGSNATISITDLFGKTVYQAEQLFSQGKITIEPQSNLSSGVYFVQVTQNDKKVVKRLLVK